MLDKILIPLEDVEFRGADNKVRLRYRLKSKDGNETSQWSPIYAINSSEINNIDNSGGVTVNPIEYSGWKPISYTDENNLYIKFDTGWINDKKIIPHKNFDAFVSWNYADSIINIPPQTPTSASGVMTFTTSAAHNISRFQTIIISGSSEYDGTFITQSGTAGTTLKIISSNYGPNTTIGTVDIVEKWGYEISNSGTIESGTVSSPSGSDTLATVSDIDVTNLKYNDLLRAKPGSGTFGDTTTTTIVTSVIGSKIRINTNLNLTSGPPTIVAGTVANISKFSKTSRIYGYSGSSSNNGQIVIKIPKQIYTNNNVIQYKYYLVPKSYPPTLIEGTGTSSNWLYLSNNLTTKPTITIGTVDNTIDGGSPS